MEIGVKVLGEHPLTGALTHTSSAYLTFVALDENGKPAPVPPVDPQTDEEKRRLADGQNRTAQRKTRRQERG